MKDIKKDLKKNREDMLYHGAKVVVGMAPFVGRAINEVISAVFVEPVSRRRDDWMCELFGRLKKLEKQIEDFQIEKLKDKPEFVTTVFNASRIAIANHEREKLDALRNAVLNVAVDPDKEQVKRQIFIHRIESLSSMHLKLLSESETNKNAIANAKQDKEIAKQIFADLENFGLIKKGFGTIAGVFESKMTKLGIDFLNFIRFELPGESGDE